ncbi:MAG: radical SAM family heme chaperone HemW [Bacillota bacterium]
MPIGLYIHIPFCLKKCNYCSFVSFPGEDGLVSSYIGALGREIEIRARALAPEERIIDSVYVGGGTPTCLSGEQLAGLTEKVFSCFSVEPGAEITVEANPGTIDRGKLATLKNAGYNRLSLGFQACHPDLLNTLGRIHSYPGAEMSFLEARRAGFDNISVDLIFGIPGQSSGQWRSCLERVADLGPDHISAYGLQLEENTPLYGAVQRGTPAACPEDLEADMYADLMETLAAYGYIHYEISNFALPGRFCRHNLRYWHNREYLGLGLAAHSYLGGKRFSNEADLGRYFGGLAEDRLPVCWEEETDAGTEMSETVFLGLRLVEGLDTGKFRERFGKGIGEVYGREIERLAALKLIEMSGNHLRLTRRGLMLGNLVFAEFV